MPQRRDRLPTPVFLGFSCGSAGKESTCNAGDLGVGKIPWRRERIPTPVFWPGEFHGLSPWDCKESDMTEKLSLHWAFSGFMKNFRAHCFLLNPYGDYIERKLPDLT